MVTLQRLSNQTAFAKEGFIQAEEPFSYKSDEGFPVEAGRMPAVICLRIIDEAAAGRKSGLC